MKKVIFIAITILMVFGSNKAQNINTFAGTISGFSGDGGLATAAKLNISSSVCRDIYNNVYIADQLNHRIRKVDNNGIITTIAGTGVSGFSGDGGQAILAQFNRPTCVAVDTSGNLYVSDRLNDRVRKISPSGIVTTIAGTGVAGFSGDGGAAILAKVNDPWGLAIDKNNSVYLADRSNDRVRKITSAGIISTVAGTTGGFSGDGGLASLAKLNAPISLCFDTLGNLFIADENNNRIRKIAATNIITTIAGNGSAGFAGDGGLATNAQLNAPCGVYCDFAGNIYISDRMNQRVRKVNVTTSNISTIAGNGLIGNQGDGGPATSARLNYPRELFSDGAGNIYIADADNHRIRQISFCPLPTIPTLAASSISICAGASVTLTIAAGVLNSATNWQWCTGACGGTTVGLGTSIIVTPTITTTYYARGIGGCTVPYGCGGITITVNSPTLSISGSTAVCTGSSSTLTASGANSYTWNSGPTTATVLVSPTVNTSYTVSGTNLAGCQNTQTINIIANPLPTVSINASTLTSCAGSTVSLTASGANTYSWSTTSTNTTIIVSPLTTTNYTLTGSNNSGCKNSITQTINVNTLPTITVTGNLIICNGNTTTLNATGANTYSWSTSSTANTITVTPIANTTYSVIGTDSNGCKNSVSKTVTVNPLPIVNITGPTSVCIGSAITLTATGANTYSWNTNIVTNTISVSPAVNTGYTVTGTNSNGCVNVFSKTITVNALPTINAVSSTSLICTGQAVTLTATGANTYTWNNSITNSVIIVSPTVNTTYTVTGTNSNNCSNSVTVVQNVSTCTDIKTKNVTTTDLLAYPNPANESFIIETAEKMIIRLFDPNGKEVLSKEITEGKTIIDISEFANGIYFLRTDKHNYLKIIKH